MKLLMVTVSALVALAFSPMHLQAADCWTGEYYVFTYYPYSGQQIAQGSTFYIYFEFYYAPNGQFAFQIRPTSSSTWTTLYTNLPYYHYDYGYGDGYGYGYSYLSATMPWTVAPGQYYGRVVEITTGADCYRNYPYDYTGGAFTVTRGCRTPTISQQPVNTIGCQGSSVNLTAVTSVDPGFISWEWYKNGSLYSSSTTTSTLSFPSIQPADAGTYYLKVKDACGLSVNSNNVTVSVQTPAIITTEPVGATVCEGNSYTMTIAASGNQNTYQWYRNGTALAGANGLSYLISSATDANAGEYYVVATGSCGKPDTSNKVNIIVPTKPTWITPLQGGTFCPGSNASLTANVTGSILAYQWYKGDTPIQGANQRTYTITGITAQNNGFYWVHVTVPGSELTGCPAETKSDRVYVSVYDAPIITQQPASVNMCAGGNTRLVVNAEGADLSYQWFFNGSPIANSNNYALALDKVSTSQAGTYTVRVNGICGFSSMSQGATVTVFNQPMITKHPVNQNVQVGQTITLSIEATGAQTITWLHNEQEIAKGTNTTLTIPNATVQHSGYYRALVENVCGGAPSQLARVIVTDPNTLIPTIALAQPALNAGDVPYGYDREVTFDALIMNAGNVPFDVTGLSFTGGDAADFSIVNGGTPFTLNKGESRSVTVNFRPSRVGASNATLQVTSTATAGNSTASITGNGVVLYSVNGDVLFGVVDLRETRVKCFSVNNASATDVVIDQITVGGANASEFRISTALPTTVAAGSTKEICVEFSPQAVGQRLATLSIMSSTGGNSTVNASGTCEIASSVISDGREVGMSIFPNPAAGQVTINTGSVDATSVLVFDAQGALVQSITPNGKTITWNLVNTDGVPVATGAYTVVVQNEAGSYHLSLQVVR